MYSVRNAGLRLQFEDFGPEGRSRSLGLQQETCVLSLGDLNQAGTI